MAPHKVGKYKPPWLIALFSLAAEGGATHTTGACQANNGCGPRAAGTDYARIPR